MGRQADEGDQYIGNELLLALFPGHKHFLPREGQLVLESARVPTSKPGVKTKTPPLPFAHKVLLMSPP